MIDLTNENHKRGVMILSSKDVRAVDRNLFDYQVGLTTIDTTLAIIKSRINNLDIDDSIKNATISDLDFMLDRIGKANTAVERAREVFR